MYGSSGSYSIEMWRAEDENDFLASQFQHDVWEELRGETDLESCLGRLSVTVTGREVTLRGTVRRYPEKAIAGRAACRVPGVAAVRNAIQVELGATDNRADHVIADQVRCVLSWDTLLPQDRIDVGVRNGYVTLCGVVDREHQRAAAEQMVEPLVGVMGIVNQITVRPMYATGDLQRRVVDAMRRLRAQRVRVETHGGTVELRGRVASLAEQEQIERAIREIPGVTSLEDGLRIER